LIEKYKSQNTSGYFLNLDKSQEAVRSNPELIKE
jgi:hypothetical protein